VYLCMKARGFDGRLPTLAPARFGLRDALFTVSVGAACLAARMFPVAHWLGALALGTGAQR
jgi:predicted phage tail protein